MLHKILRVHGFICKVCEVRTFVSRVKSGIFRQTAKFGRSPCLFHSSIIGIKNKFPKQTVKIPMFHFDVHCLQVCVSIYLMSEFTRLYPTAMHKTICNIRSSNPALDLYIYNANFNG